MLSLFEDRLASQFNPVALTRHLGELLVGSMTLRQRACRLLEEEDVILHGREAIRRNLRMQGERVEVPADYSGPVRFLNARVPLLPSIVATFPTDKNWVMVSGDSVVAALLDSDRARELDWSRDALDFSALDGVPGVEVDLSLPRYLWDLLGINGALIDADAAAIGAGVEENPPPGAHFLSPERISIAPGCRISPGVVIDAGGGAVIIGRNVTLMANAVIEGPCSVGENSTIKIGAKIYGQTSIGPWCKVGGEVENSIILGYSNKQHDGFLGHSYLGRWVNLGADTNTSDLKNNYGPIRATLDGKAVDTGRMFLGSLIGDHSKTGINTMLNTGTVIGVAANIFGGGFPPKDIPSFSWGGSEGFVRFDTEKGIELARTVMARRNVELTVADEELLREIASSGFGDSEAQGRA
jgi:UDP-N-acetylglucosamine diphosphorylase/glucosamine-1-phosphate N-acetyltransferase